MDGKKVNILIANDNPEEFATLSEHMESGGVNALITGERKNVVQSAQNLMPDIIFLDIQMPGISGIEICRQLKAEINVRKIPVIFMMPIAAVENKARAFEVGAADYITKPFQKEEVMARLMIHLRVRELSAALFDVKEQLKQGITKQTIQLAEANRALKQKIEERNQAFESLKTSERKLKAVLDQSFGFVGVISLDGRVLEANRTALAFIGRGFEDIHNQLFWETPWWSHSRIFAERLEASVKKAAKGEVIRFEATHESVLGERHYIDFSLKPIDDGKGNVLMLLAEGHDITELKKTSEALSASHSYLYKIINTVADPIFVKDRRHQWVLLNDAFCSFVGYEREQLIGKSDYDFFPREEADVFYAKDEIVLTTGKENTNEEQVTNAKGSVRTILTKKTRYVDEQGTPFIVGIIRDITKSKLMETQLRQAAKMEAIGTLAGGIAHDFNNMLSVILGYTELALEHKDLSQQLLEALQEIMNAAERSADVTRQLLAFARKQAISPRLLDLNRTLSNMLNMLRRLIGEDIYLTWNPGENIRPVKMDPSQIDQILVNLCVNARDAIGSVGRITIDTRMVSFDEKYCKHNQDVIAGDFVQLSVSDDGCGMERETLTNLFEPFFTTKGGEKGTGLGLATVYGIVKQNNGFINVYSEPKNGTTFKIFLPSYETVEEQLHENSVVSSDSGGRETILLVEDEHAILAMTKMMLEKSGYNVLAATTPRQAMELAKEHGGQIHLLMTDVVMPEMNGHELTRHLLSTHPKLKHLFISGYTSDIITNHGILDEGVNFIQKPFSKKDLSAKVREVLND